MVQVPDNTSSASDGTRSAEWRPVVGFAGYWVSDRGGVRRGARDLKPTARRGYLRVWLSRDGLRVMRSVHVLVLETFVGPRPSQRHHAAHSNENDRTRNTLDNLEWKLPEENEADKKRHGTVRGGGKKEPAADVERIRARAAAGESYTRIAADEGLHRHSVSRIVRGLRRRAA